MDISSRKKLSDIIHTATNTGLLDLSSEHINSLKDILKVSNTHVKAAFDILIDKLKSKHSQVRISTVNIIHEIFNRSKYFRELICQSISLYMEYTLGFNTSNPLPPPAQSAKILKTKSLENIEKWFESYGEHYIILKNTYYYLKNSLKIDFPEIRNQALQRTNEERERRENTQKILKIKYNKLKLEFANESNRISTIMDDIDESLKSIIPDLNDFESLFNQNNNNSETNKASQEDNDSNGRRDNSEIVRNGGFGSLSYSITVDGNNEEELANENPIDQGKLVIMSRGITEVEKFQNLILNDWHQTLIKININPQLDLDYTQYLRRVIELQNRISNLKTKCADLHIVPFENLELEQDKENTSQNDGDDVDDDEFEEYLGVKTKKTTTTTTSKDNVDDNVYKPNANNTSIDSIKSVDTDVDKGDEDNEDGDLDETFDDLLKRAPVVPSNPSLYYWGEKSIDLNTSGINREHRFYGEASSNTVIPLDNFQQYRQMTYYYTPTQKNIKSCRAPLKDGNGLCKRKDLVFCPFHGTIVNRDENGNPTGDDTNQQTPNEFSNLINKEPEQKKPTKKRKSSNLIDLNDRDTVKSKIEKVLSNLGK